MTRELIDDWLRVHRELMAREAEFTALALKAATGDVPVETLDEARAHLLGMRELCNAVYAKAFPAATGRHMGGSQAPGSPDLPGEGS